jgi:hypothetical protein
MPDRPQKITFAEMRDSGVRGLLVFCADFRCSPPTPPPTPARHTIS